MTRSLLIVISVLIVAIMGFTGFAAAYALTHTTGTTATTQATSTATSVPTAPTTTSGGGTRKATGTILSISGQIIVITLASGKSLKVSVTDQTAYTKHGGQATFSDLQVGEKIRVQGIFNQHDKTLTAASVTIVG